MLDQLKRAAPKSNGAVGSPEGRRRATQLLAASFEHIPAELLAHQLPGAAVCDAALIEYGIREGYSVRAEKIAARCECLGHQ